MVSKIALFNHEAGLGKTAITFNLGWMLAAKGKRVILLDADPQCHLTEMFLSFSAQPELEELYHKNQNIKAGLAPAFEAQPRLIRAIDCIGAEGQKRLYLLPGHVGLAEYEATLALAQELSASLETLKNLPGAITYLLNQTAQKYSADYILIDMSPSLGAINQNLLMTSDFFALPLPSSFFSLLALDSLASILPKWRQWSLRASQLKRLQQAEYPYPEIKPSFLGTIIFNNGSQESQFSKAVPDWVEKIKSSVIQNLVPLLQENHLLLPNQSYFDQGMEKDFCLIEMSNFNPLITVSKSNQTPIFTLTPEQIGQTGKMLEKTVQSQAQLQNDFSALADKILNLTANAVCA
ncbi:MAG: AAA family ATPase [Cyanobacteria bacterium RI_101]|nr:AAA family ATPase [Cyanobacteria bacterium RI_101]